MTPKGWTQPALATSSEPITRPVLDLVTRGMSHNQWVDQVVEWAHRGGWRCYVMHDSRTQHWGTDTGWPDVFCADEIGLGRQAVAIECKTGSGRERTDQAEWRVALSAAGVHCLVAYPRDGEYVRDLLLNGVPLSAQVTQARQSKSGVRGRLRSWQKRWPQRLYARPSDAKEVSP